MSKCVDTIARLADPQLSLTWETLSVGDMLSLQNAATTMHMHLDVIGWMVLRAESPIIHGDPHPGNAMSHFQARMQVVPDDADDDYSADSRIFNGDGDEHPGFELKVPQCDMGELLESAHIDQNVLSLLDYGSAIRNPEMLAVIRPAMQIIVRSLCELEDAEAFDADPTVIEALATMGMPPSAASLMRVILKGKPSEDGSSVAARMANRDQATTQRLAEEAMKEFEADMDKFSLSQDIVTLMNVLVFGGGIAMEMDRVLGELWARFYVPPSDGPVAQRMPVAAATIWRHWT